MNDSEDIITISSSSSDYIISDYGTSDSLTMGTLDISSITASGLYTSSIPTYTIGTSGIDSITFPDSIYGYDINLTEFEEILPSIEKVKEMCEEYPALEKAYENFKLIYKLVHDDWEAKLRGDND